MSEHSKPKDIIIVSGLPRSGTSMLMKMLAAGKVPILTDELRKPDEDNPKGYFEFEPVKKLGQSEDLSWLDRAAGQAVKIVSPLLVHLPREGYRYKVVFVRRHLNEILASQRKMLERRGEPTDSTGDEAMFNYFMKHLDEVLDYLENEPAFEVIFVYYRKVLAEPLAHAEKIAEFLGLDLDIKQMQREVDPSLWRNRA